MVEQELEIQELQSKPPLTRSDFEIVKFLGEGANAKVYKIRMLKDERIYALKQMRI